MRPLFLLAGILLAYGNDAQTPGGIAANLRAWYDAGTGVSVSGSAVTQWNDRTANAFHGTQVSAVSRPTNLGVINYNTAIDFDGVNDFLNIPDLVAAASTGITCFAVARQMSTTNDAPGCILVGQTNNIGASGGYGFTAQNFANTAFGFFVRDWGVNFVSYNTTLSRPAVMTGNWNGTTANAIQYFQDGVSRGTDNYTPGSVGDNGNSYIGSGVGSGTDYCFDGLIAEIAVYNTGLNAASVNRIESYLAIKYGITLGSNYVNAAGTTLYTTTAPYNNNIIGIGQDNSSGLLQKQSQAFDDSTRVFIGTLAASNAANAGTFPANNSFIVMGANTAQIKGVVAEKPGSIYSRIEREWKVTNTGFTGTFSFALKLSAGAIPGSVNPAHLRLLVDADGNFTDATIYNSGGGLSFSYSNPVITVSGISTAMIPTGSTRYITLASNVSATPLPLELLFFRAQPCMGEVCLQWKTAHEENTSHFEVERSANGIDWKQVNSCAATNVSSQVHNYEITDYQALPGVSYYRLLQWDRDGSMKISPVAVVQNGNLPLPDPFVFPNPADEYVTIEDVAEPRCISLYDHLGSEVSQRCYILQEETSVRVILSGLEDGVYFLCFDKCQAVEPRRMKLVVRH